MSIATGTHIADIYPVRSWMSSRDNWLVELDGWPSELTEDESEILSDLHGGYDVPATAGRLRFEPVPGWTDTELAAEDGCVQVTTGVWYPSHEYCEGTCTRCGAEEAGDAEEPRGRLYLAPPASEERVSP